MDLDLDPFDDILPQPVRNARSGAKFQPKAKLQPRKEKHTTLSTSLTNAAKDIPVTTTTVHQDSSHSVSLTHIPDTVTSTTTLINPLPELQDQEPHDSTVVIHSELPLPDADRFAPVDIPSPHHMDQEYLDSRDSVHSECTIFSTNGDIQLERETADIFFGLDDFIDGSTTPNASRVRKFQPKIKVNVQAENNFPASCDVATLAESSISHAKDLEGGPDRPPTDTSPELVLPETANSSETGAFDHEEDFLLDIGRLGREEQAFPGFDSLNFNSKTTSTGGAQSFPSEIEYRDDDLHSGSADCDFADLSTISASHSAVPEISELPEGEYLMRVDDSVSNPPIPPEASESQAVPIISGKEKTRSRKRKSSTTVEDSAMEVQLRNVAELSQETLDGRPSIEADEGNESSKSSRRLRKRSNAPVLAEETEGGTEEDMSLLAEPSKNSLVDEDVSNAGDDDYQEDTSRRKRAAKKAKPAVPNEKAGRRRKVSSEGPDSSSKEPPKKKFSHSTRRNRRKVNKILLETPEDEIDFAKLPIKDIILLGEIREERMKKDAATSKKSLPNQSANNSFPEDAPYDDDDPFGSGQGLNADVDEAPLPRHNYHSFMKKRPKKRWSKQDTELFYKAIRQFGTDFTMIEQIFPDNHDLFPNNHDRRRQLVLKFKNEERRHPMKLHDALTNRSKDHSHFELVIEKLQRAAQAEQTSERDLESVGISGEAEDNDPETNEEAQSEQKDEIADDLETADDPEANGFGKHTHEIEDDDGYNWSPSKKDGLEGYGFAENTHEIEDDDGYNWSPSKKDDLEPYDFAKNTHGIENDDDYNWSPSKNKYDDYGGY